MCFASPAFAQNNRCGNARIAPQVFSVAINYPASLSLGIPAGYSPLRGRLTRSGIEYVSGNSMRLELVTDRCATVRGVRVGSLDLRADPNSTINFHASAAETQPADPQRFAHRIQLFLPPVGAGADGPISITVGRERGPGTAIANLQMARVAAVETVHTAGEVSISSDEVSNLIAQANQELFGPDDSAILRANGKTYRIYGYDPSSLGVSITENGISFSFKFKFKFELDYVCDPTVRAWGEFKFRADHGALLIDWVNGPDVSLEWPAFCRGLLHIPGAFQIADYLIRNRVSDAPGSIKSEIEADINEFIAASSVGGVQFARSTTRNNELRIGLYIPAESVTLRVPYDPFTLSGGTVFGPNETLLLLASDLGMNEAVASGRGTVNSAPNGLPRAGSVDWPGARTVARPGGGLLSGDLAVGRLLARPLLPRGTLAGAAELSEQPTFAYQPGCTLRTPASARAGLPRFRFGVNDAGDAARRLRGIGARGYRLRVFFVKGWTLSDRLLRCRRLEEPGRSPF